ncbi:hypothetical protein [Tetragenococcus halophilus]|uniref:hypothetical protein n=1 Tax=Tetragenococcus halophilus TaxID=51669 RepID=UPI00295EED0B|nr:hypothetical protein [Tetragenococcus halophilus]
MFYTKCLSFFMPLKIIRNKEGSSMSIFQAFDYERSPSKKNQEGKIQRYYRNKGYESIPRDFAQNESLSYEARGLLISIASYPENFKLYKCELYRRSEKNSRRKIDHAWEELISQGFILQFRKREGRIFLFTYVYSLESYNQQDILGILEEAKQSDYHFYHRSIRNKEERTLQNYLNIFSAFLSNSDLKEVKAWLEKNESPIIVDQNDDENSNDQSAHSKNKDLSNVQNEQPIVESSWGSSNRLTKERLTSEKRETEDRDTEKIDTQGHEEKSFFSNPLSEIVTQTFLTTEAIDLIAENSENINVIKETIDLMYQAKKYVQDHLDGFPIVAEYFDEQTYLLLQRFYFKKRTKKLNSPKGYFYNMVRNHWLEMAEMSLHQSHYPNKMKYLTLCQDLYQKLSKEKV